MGIMTRMLRLCKADVHGVMDQLEDKGLLLKQSLREMETSLDLKARQVGGLARQIGRLNGRIAAHREEADKLERDLTLALRKEKDEIARMLIRKRRALVAAAEQLSRQAAAMTRERAQLAETLAAQRLEYETLKAKAEVYWQQVCDRPLETAAEDEPGLWAEVQPAEAEIELELLERKEALQKGGTP